MDEKSAELTNAANSFWLLRLHLDEIANLCERVGADVDNVRKGIGTDFRIGKHFCMLVLAMGEVVFKDVQALNKTMRNATMILKSSILLWMLMSIKNLHCYVS